MTYIIFYEYVWNILRACFRSTIFYSLHFSDILLLNKYVVLNKNS